MTRLLRWVIDCLAQAPHPVSFYGGGVTGVQVLKGEIADYGANLATTANASVTLVGVRLIPVPG